MTVILGGVPQPSPDKHRNTCISWMLSSSLVSTFFSTPSPRSKASRVVLSEVNPSFFRGSSTSEKQGQKSNVRPLKQEGQRGGPRGHAGTRAPGWDSSRPVCSPLGGTGTLELGPAFPSPVQIPATESSPACCPKDSRGRTAKDTFGGHGAGWPGLCPASATLQPCDFGARRSKISKPFFTSTK